MDGYLPWTTPYTPPSACQDTGNGTAYDNADFDEALCLGHGNATHKPNSDDPVFDPDTFWAMHPGGCNFLFGDGSVHFLKIQHEPGRVSILDDQSRRRNHQRQTPTETWRRDWAAVALESRQRQPNKPADAGHSPCFSPLFRRRT